MSGCDGGEKQNLLARSVRYTSLTLIEKVTRFLIRQKGENVRSICVKAKKKAAFEKEEDTYSVVSCI